jgi:hypothetical protein
MRSFIDLIEGAFIVMGLVWREVMHCAMHWDMTAWKSQTAFSIRMSIHFAAVIIAFGLQPSLCLTPADFMCVVPGQVILPQQAYSQCNC